MRRQIDTAACLGITKLRGRRRQSPRAVNERPSRRLALPPSSPARRIRLGRTFHSGLGRRRFLAARADGLEHALSRVARLLNLFGRSLLGALGAAGAVLPAFAIARWFALATRLRLGSDFAGSFFARARWPLTGPAAASATPASTPPTFARLRALILRLGTLAFLACALGGDVFALLTLLVIRLGRIDAGVRMSMG